MLKLGPVSLTLYMKELTFNDIILTSVGNCMRQSLHGISHAHVTMSIIISDVLEWYLQERCEFVCMVGYWTVES